jgi:hypothetical protein
MSMVPRLALSHKVIAGLAVGILAVGAAVGAFASQDALPVLQSHDDKLAQTIDDDAVGLQDESASRATDDEDGATNEGNSERDVGGIPEDNPDHQQDNGDGDCDKGETAVKTTPSGNEVRVPCQAVKAGPPGLSQGHRSGDDEATDEEDGGRVVVGIPEDNPNHQADGDGECEKAETAIKTTPSGNQVTVPCHAVEAGPPSFSRGHEGDNDLASNGDDSGDDSGQDER